MKAAIRSFAIWLRAATDKWVVTDEIQQLVADGTDASLTLAHTKLEQAERQWPGDPQIVYAQTLISFLKDPA